MMKNRNKEEERRWVLHTYIFTLLHMVCHKWRINGKNKIKFGQPPSPTAAVKPASLTTGNNSNDRGNKNNEEGGSNGDDGEDEDHNGNESHGNKAHDSHPTPATTAASLCSQGA
jgi:hypothetical protein